MDLGPHAAFIVIAYAAVTVIVAALVLWIVVDYRKQLDTLGRLEAEGVVRRSAQQSADRA